MIRINDSETGDIIVTAPDEISDLVKVTATRLDEPAEAITLIAGKTDQIEIGSYRLSFSGIDSEKYEFTKDTVTITTKVGAQVSIRHTTPASGHPVTGKVNPGLASDVEPNERTPRFSDVDESRWVPGDRAKENYGLVHAPANLPGIGGWTILPTLGNGGAVQDVYTNSPADLSSDGQHYAYFTPFDIRIADVVSGKPVASIPRTSWHGAGARFSPDGKTMLVPDRLADGVALFDLSGRLLKSWANPVGPRAKGPLWAPDGSGVVFWSSKQARIVDTIMGAAPGCEQSFTRVVARLWPATLHIPWNRGAVRFAKTVVFARFTMASPWRTTLKAVYLQHCQQMGGRERSGESAAACRAVSRWPGTTAGEPLHSETAFARPAGSHESPRAAVVLSGVPTPLDTQPLSALKRTRCVSKSGQFRMSLFDDLTSRGTVQRTWSSSRGVLMVSIWLRAMSQQMTGSRNIKS